MEPTSLKLVLMAVIAGIVLGFFATNLAGFREERVEGDFARSSEEIARRIRSLKTQGPGAQVPAQVDVPEGCVLEFENGRVKARNGGAHSFDTGANLAEKSLEPGSYRLIIERTRDGIRITER